MNCERFTNIWSDLAASGEPPSHDSRTHLSDCPACQQAFERERILFAAIDTGVRESANPTPSFTFSPQVLANIDPAPTHTRPQPIVALAGIAAALLLVTIVQWKTPKQISPGNSVADSHRPEAARSTAEPAQLHTADARPAFPCMNTQRRRRSPIPQKHPREDYPREQVLVPGDQEFLLARYAAAFHDHARPTVPTGSETLTSMQPLEIALIQIAQVDVKPLTDERE